MAASLETAMCGVHVPMQEDLRGDCGMISISLSTLDHEIGLAESSVSSQIIDIHGGIQLEVPSVQQAERHPSFERPCIGLSETLLKELTVSPRPVKLAPIVTIDLSDRNAIEQLNGLIDPSERSANTGLIDPSTRTDLIDSSERSANTGLIDPSKRPAKTHLYEICTAYSWNPPKFDCCEEGQGHLKMFTSRVTVQVEGTSITVIECCSEPKTKKKAAAEHAAEGALWYLKHLGY